MVAAPGWCGRSYAARAGRLTIGDVSVFIAAIAGVQNGLAIVISTRGGSHEAMILFGHYREVVSAAPACLARRTAGPAGRCRPLRSGIELRDVWFRYGDDHAVGAARCTLTIPAGAATALVGLNGAGKSTLVKLLCRFYDPTRGAILWDGVDLRELPVDELRGRIGAVFQDFMAYDLTRRGEHRRRRPATRWTTGSAIVAAAAPRRAATTTLDALPARLRHDADPDSSVDTDRDDPATA